MNQNFFYYEDGLENVFNKNGEKVVDPMAGVLTDIIDPNTVLATLTIQAGYLTVKPGDDKDTEMEDAPANKKAPINST